MGKKVAVVNLSQEERDHLENLVSKGVESARKLTRARILLKADQQWTDEQIHQALDVSISTVARIRTRYVNEGLDAAISRKPTQRVYECKMDGRHEAHLIALVCSGPPEGRAAWSLRLLAERFVELEQVEIDSISHETVRQVLKKNEIKPWQRKEWVIAPQANAEFVCRMENILDLYQQEIDPTRPLVCFDEASKQLLAEVRTPLPLLPGQAVRYDSEYIRVGVVNMFMFFSPFDNWRHVEVTNTRTKIDFAHMMKYLVDECYPDAETIQVVLDNLNTHTPAALYEVYPPAEARRIVQRLQFHYTPKHGSWLNMAEIELSILKRQCLDRRIADQDTLRQEISAW